MANTKNNELRNDCKAVPAVSWSIITVGLCKSLPSLENKKKITDIVV